MIPATMKTSLPLVLVLAAASALPTVGCKRLAERAAEKAEEKAIEKQTGGQVSINGQKGTMTIVTDAGAMTMGELAKIPEDFPKNVPIYPGSKPTVAVKSATGGQALVVGHRRDDGLEGQGRRLLQGEHERLHAGEHDGPRHVGDGGLPEPEDGRVADRGQRVGRQAVDHAGRHDEVGEAGERTTTGIRAARDAG